MAAANEYSIFRAIRTRERKWPRPGRQNLISSKQHIPPYFFSALCVLFGMFLVSQGLREMEWKQGQIILTVVIQCYEILLIAGAALLIYLGRILSLSSPHLDSTLWHHIHNIAYRFRFSSCRACVQNRSRGMDRRCYRSHCHSDRAFQRFFRSVNCWACLLLESLAFSSKTLIYWSSLVLGLYPIVKVLLVLSALGWGILLLVIGFIALIAGVAINWFQRQSQEEKWMFIHCFGAADFSWHSVWYPPCGKNPDRNFIRMKMNSIKILVILLIVCSIVFVQLKNDCYY